MLDIDTKGKMFNNFSWSFSRLKGYEDCPRRYHELMVLKRFKEERREHLDEGEAIHRALARSLRQGVGLPKDYEHLQHWVDRLLRTQGELLVEDDCKWAINRNFQPTGYFDRDCWLRGQADAVKLDDVFAMVVDWKNGKSMNADELQLILMALMVFTHYPKVLRVRADFIWLQHDSQTSKVIDRKEMPDYWTEILPRAGRLETAHKSNNFPPTPNRFCRAWCPVSTCQYWGK